MKFSFVVICFCLGAITSANYVEATSSRQPLGIPNSPIGEFINQINYRGISPRFLNPDAILLQIFETLKWVIKNGSPDITPVLDPMMFQHYTLQITLPNNLITLNANLTNGTIRGLGDFEVQRAEFIKEDIAVDLSISLPLLILTADHYEMKGNIYQAVPLAGNGTFGLQMTNFHFRSKIYLTQSEDGESVIIDRFENTQCTIEKITSQTEFDRNIDDIFNKLIEDLLADYLTRFSKLIIDKYSGAALETINPFLDQFETWRFIAAIL